MTGRSTRRSRWISPLRYPGGKARMAEFLADLFCAQSGPLPIEIWMEPFAGGAGAGLTLLSEEVIDELWLVEKNPAIAALWRSILGQGDALASRVEQTVPTMTLWGLARQTLIAAELGEAVDDLEFGFAALIVNRCSRSGIVSPAVGPIGGKRQTGPWGVGARFNAERIADRIRDIFTVADRICFWEGDAIEHVAELNASGIGDELVLFVDPPYLREGNRLYRNGMSAIDHQGLADALNRCLSPWMLTYDDEPSVAELLYPDRRVRAYEIAHTTNKQRVDWEYAVFSDNLAVAPDPPLLARGRSHWLRREPTRSSGGAEVEPPRRSRRRWLPAGDRRPGQGLAGVREPAMQRSPGHVPRVCGG